MIIGRTLERGIDIIGEILGFLTVLLVVFLCINNVLPKGFLNDGLLSTLNTVAYFGMFIVVGLKGLEFALKRNLLVFLIYAAIVAAGIILMFFPGVVPSAISKAALLF